MRTPVLIAAQWRVDVQSLGRRSGSGLCRGATRQGIAGGKLTVMRPTPTGDAPPPVPRWRASSASIRAPWRAGKPAPMSPRGRPARIGWPPRSANGNPRRSPGRHRRFPRPLPARGPHHPDRQRLRVHRPLPVDKKAKPQDRPSTRPRPCPGLRRARHRPPAHPTLPAADQRHGRALQPPPLRAYDTAPWYRS
jgi:hypothetical protein